VTLRLRTPVLLLLLLSALAVLLALGGWQFGRHQEKQGLAERLGQRTEQPPIALERADEAPAGPDLDFRLVRIAGSWDIERSLIVTNRVRFGTRGEQLVVPLRPAGGGPAVLVDRGWYPLELRDEVRARLAQEPAGIARGMARQLDAGVARLVPGAGWTAFHPASMATALPYAVVDWGLIEGEAARDTGALAPPSPGQLPETGYLPYRNTIPHLEYALTWWGLAATLAVVAVVRLRVAPGRRQTPDADASDDAGAEGP